MSNSLRRLLSIGGGTVVFAAALVLIMLGLSGNRLFFHNPTALANGEVDTSRAFRIGGLVEPGSWSQLDDGLVHRFQITDCRTSVAVHYRGLLPDLFIEGQGAVVRGAFDAAQGILVADEVLARHDEEYTPREVEIALSDPDALRGEYAEMLNNGCGSNSITRITALSTTTTATAASAENP